MKKQPSGGWSARDLKASFVAEKSKLGNWECFQGSIVSTYMILESLRFLLGGMGKCKGILL